MYQGHVSGLVETSPSYPGVTLEVCLDSLDGVVVVHALPVVNQDTCDGLSPTVNSLSRPYAVN